MVRMGAPGTGFSSADPSKAVETWAGLAAKNGNSGGGSSSRSSPTSQPTVKINGEQVFINGQGFSVAPSLQAEFIKQQTGGSGSSAQAAINLAKKLAEAAALKLAQQKAQDAAAAKLADARAKLALNKVSNLQTNIIRNNGSVTQKKSRDVKTGNNLIITEYKQGSNKVRRVFNEATGGITFNTYGVGKAGGGVRRTGGVKLWKDTNQLITSKFEGHLAISSKDAYFETRQIRNNGGGLVWQVYFVDKARGVNMVVPLKYQKEFKLGGYKVSGLDASTVLTTTVTSQKGDILVSRIKEKPQDIVKVNPITGFATKVNQDTRNEINRLAEKNKRTFIEQAKMLGFEFAIPFQELGIAVTVLPSFAKSLVSNPKNILKVPGQFWSGIKQSGAELYSLAKISPTRAVARIGGEVVLIIIGGKALKVTGKVSSKVANKLNPFLKKVKNGKIIVRGTPAQTFMVKGKVRMLKTRVKAPSIRRPFSSIADFLKGRKPGQFKKFTKDPGLILKSQTVKSGASPLSKQALLAGKEVTAVNAAAQQLTNWLKFKKIVRKPFPNQLGNSKNYSVFPKKIGNLIKKFDNGVRLTTREFANVNKWLQKNVAANTTLLERSLYLDPASGLRISRLGIQSAKDATLRDILRGNFKLWNKAGKPQILVFENAKIAKFPKSLSVVRRKLLAGKKLTVAETNKLIEWQVKVGSGKFKPIGSTIYSGGIELEITLAPGELIKRIKRVGTVVIENKRVSIVTAEIFKPTKKLLLKMKKANLGKLPKTQLASLEKSLSKKLGRKIRIETPSLRKITKKSIRRIDANIPVLRVRGGSILVSRLLGRTSMVIRRVSKRIVKHTVRATKRKPIKRTVKRTPRTTKRTTRKTPKRTGKRTAKRTTRKPPRTTRPGRTIRRGKDVKKPVIVPRVPKGFKKQSIKKSVPVFYVKVKAQGRIKNLTPRPLTLTDAKDFLAYRIDHRLSRSAWFESLGKTNKVVRLPKSMRGYFGRNKGKLRPFKIRVGKNKQIRNGYIEKIKHNLDKKSEVRALALARRRARLRRSGKKKVAKRKVETTRKKVTKRRVSKVSTKRRKVVRRRPTKRKIIKRKVKPIKRRKVKKRR